MVHLAALDLVLVSAARAPGRRRVASETPRALSDLEIGFLAVPAPLPGLPFQRPLAIVIRQAVPQNIAGMVENDRRLAGLRTESAPDLLQVEREGLRWPQEDRRLHRRHVEPLRNEIDVGQDLNVAAGEGVHYPLAPTAVLRAVDVLRANADRAELLGDVLRMIDGDAEGDGPLVPGEPQVVPDRVAGDGRPVHRLGQLVLREIAGAGPHPLQVDADGRRVHHVIGKEPGVDQVARCRAADHGFEQIIQAPAVSTAGRGREADRLGAGIPPEHPEPGVARAVVRLVKDDQVRQNDVVEAPHQGQHAGHLDHIAAHGMSRRDQAVIDAHGLEGAAGLEKQLLAMNDEHGALAALGGPRRHPRHEHGLAAAGRQLVEDAAVAGRDRRPQPPDVSLLVVPQGEGHPADLRLLMARTPATPRTAPGSGVPPCPAAMARCRCRAPVPAGASPTGRSSSVAPPRPGGWRHRRA